MDLTIFLKIKITRCGLTLPLLSPGVALLDASGCDVTEAARATILAKCPELATLQISTHVFASQTTGGAEAMVCFVGVIFHYHMTEYFTLIYF